MECSDCLITSSSVMTYNLMDRICNLCDECISKINNKQLKDKAMIDLNNTKIDCRNKDGSVNVEINNAFRKACAEQGIDEVSGSSTLDDAAFLFATNDFSKLTQVEYALSSGEDFFNKYHCKQITLADLKPVSATNNLQWHELRCGDVVDIALNESSGKTTIEILSFRKLMAIAKIAGGCYELFSSKDFNNLHYAMLASKTKPRTKAGYVKCEASDASNYHTNELFFHWGDEKIVPLRDVDAACFIINQHKLVRKVECEITWQDEVEQFIKENEYININMSLDWLIGEGDQEQAFIELSHLVASMTDKPINPA